MSKLMNKAGYVAEIPEGSVAIPTALDEDNLNLSANADIPGWVLEPGLEITNGLKPDSELLWQLRAQMPVGDFEVTVREPVLTSSTDLVGVLEETIVIREARGEPATGWA